MAIGLVREEFAVTRARIHFERVDRTTRNRIAAPAWFIDAGESAIRLAAIVVAKIVRFTHGGSDENN